MNVCIIYFSLNEPSNPLLYYFYINTMYNMFYIIFVYFCMHVFLFHFKCSKSILNERIFEKI